MRYTKTRHVKDLIPYTEVHPTTRIFTQRMTFLINFKLSTKSNTALYIQECVRKKRFFNVYRKSREVKVMLCVNLPNNSI